MHVHAESPRSQEGTTLITSLAVGLVLGITLAGYLSWARTQHVLVAESQAWNIALAHAEAGIEEGLAQINVTFGTNYLDSARTNWGWSSGRGFYGPRANLFLDGSYSAIIIPTNPGPTIISTGYAMVPIVGRKIARTVMVHTKSEPAFQYGISVVQNVSMNGNNVMVDSYNSTDPAHNTGGVYDPLKRMAGGDVVSTDGFINVGGANIYGHVRTAPWGTLSAGQGNGRVGDLETNWPARSGIETNWYSNDLNLDFPDVGEPFNPATGFSPMFYSASNTFLLGNGDYVISGNLTLQNGQTLYAAGNARLWVQGNVDGHSGNPGSYIGVATNGSIAMYVGTITGQVVSAAFYNVNSHGNATNFNYYGLPSNKSMTWGGNDSYVGTVYAPEAALTLTGGGTTRTNDFQGSCVASSLTMGGHFNFHFDENLKASGPQMGYLVSSWQEL